MPQYPQTKSSAIAAKQSINVLPKTLTKLVEILPNIKSLNKVIISENRIKNKQKHIVLKSIVLINFNISL